MFVEPHVRVEIADVQREMCECDFRPHVRAYRINVDDIVGSSGVHRVSRDGGKPTLFARTCGTRSKGIYAFEGDAPRAFHSYGTPDALQLRRLELR